MNSYFTPKRVTILGLLSGVGGLCYEQTHETTALTGSLLPRGLSLWFHVKRGAVQKTLP